jgi:hypothetical protein
MIIPRASRVRSSAIAEASANSSARRAASSSHAKLSCGAVMPTSDLRVPASWHAEHGAAIARQRLEGCCTEVTARSCLLLQVSAQSLANPKNAANRTRPRGATRSSPAADPSASRSRFADFAAQSSARRHAEAGFAFPSRGRVLLSHARGLGRLRAALHFSTRGSGHECWNGERLGSRGAP